MKSCLRRRRNLRNVYLIVSSSLGYSIIRRQYSSSLSSSLSSKSGIPKHSNHNRENCKQNVSTFTRILRRHWDGQLAARESLPLLSWWLALPPPPHRSLLLVYNYSNWLLVTERSLSPPILEIGTTPTLYFDANSIFQYSKTPLNAVSVLRIIFGFPEIAHDFVTLKLACSLAARLMTSSQKKKKNKKCQVRKNFPYHKYNFVLFVFWIILYKLIHNFRYSG